ncbi:MAG: KTSC domain-containing protein [Acidobacteria bacterium]|nr:KTSC domain-containing protein [Acidobacteriota bacterium]
MGLVYGGVIFGSVYGYAGVPQSEFDGLMGAESKGKYFNANIKNRYLFEKH